MILTVPVDVHKPPEDIEVSSNTSTVYSDAKESKPTRSRKDSVNRQRTCSTSRKGDTSRKRALSGPTELNEKRPNLAKQPIPSWVPNFLPKEQNKNHKTNDRTKDKNNRKNDRISSDC